jgi:hypothetical protein
MRNIVVLDLETLHVSDECQICHVRLPAHGRRDDHVYTAYGWGNKPALGLSIGAYYDYSDLCLHWFDLRTLHATMQELVSRHALLVTFNGVTFDFVLMRGLLRQEAEHRAGTAESTALVQLADAFKALCGVSYDLRVEMLRVDPSLRYTAGIGTLDAVATANGLPAKAISGVLCPELWRKGHYAEVLNHCADDVLKTKYLFELVMQGKPVKRGDGVPLTLSMPQPPLWLKGNIA